MAVNRVPVLKRCRALGLEPAYLGYDKKSNRIYSIREQKDCCDDEDDKFGLQVSVRENVSHYYL